MRNTIARYLRNPGHRVARHAANSPERIRIEVPLTPAPASYLVPPQAALVRPYVPRHEHSWVNSCDNRAGMAVLLELARSVEVAA
ncbi:hypothetical protein FHX37_3669 [Haloactinospora alba]|uniref:Uncharacterized protein n=1 Tax=Haloactinospora alba TaxID=405555 RepID=A0A543N929_9ACTN|nr:hypothetical protein [Haloactinospora alba]TQN28335.1 hypothetical protein FHX37_3669 [Haloactinospora alba]